MPKKILVADDSITIQKVIGLTFAGEDVELDVADNGDEAFEKAKSSSPDLIIADTNMPGLNGYELSAKIRATADLSHIPVILLAGTYEVFDHDPAEQVGANDHLTKPFESQTLIDKVNDLLDQAAEAAPVAEPEISEVEPEVVEAETIQEPDQVSAEQAQPVENIEVLDAEPEIIETAEVEEIEVVDVEDAHTEIAENEPEVVDIEEAEPEEASTTDSAVDFSDLNQPTEDSELGDAVESEESPEPAVEAATVDEMPSETPEIADSSPIKVTADNDLTTEDLATEPIEEIEELETVDPIEEPVETFEEVTEIAEEADVENLAEAQSSDDFQTDATEPSDAELFEQLSTDSDQDASPDSDVSWNMDEFENYLAGQVPEDSSETEPTPSEMPEEDTQSEGASDEEPLASEIVEEVPANEIVEEVPASEIVEEASVTDAIEEAPEQIDSEALHLDTNDFVDDEEQQDPIAEATIPDETPIEFSASDAVEMQPEQEISESTDVIAPDPEPPVETAMEANDFSDLNEASDIAPDETEAVDLSDEAPVDQTPTQVETYNEAYEPDVIANFEEQDDKPEDADAEATVQETVEMTHFEQTFEATDLDTEPSSSELEQPEQSVDDQLADSQLVDNQLVDSQLVDTEALIQDAISQQSDSMQSAIDQKVNEVIKARIEASIQDALPDLIEQSVKATIDQVLSDIKNKLT